MKTFQEFLIESGSEYTVTRETSKYNKSMKWHLVTKTGKITTSDWFKTEKAANDEIERKKNMRSKISTNR
jgi:hypothetical protein